MRLIIGISGASGVIHGIRLLAVLANQAGIETHPIISQGGRRNIALEASRDPRETPLHAGHYRLLHEVSCPGAIVAPPMPAFCNAPASVGGIIHHAVGRLLNLFGIDSGLARRRQGGQAAGRKPPGTRVQP